MFDAEIIDLQLQDSGAAADSIRKYQPKNGRAFLAAKRSIDIAAAIILLPFVGLAGLILLVLNPAFNKGTLMFRQTRMGKECVPFTAYKFRSMMDAGSVKRGAFDALEEDRITKLGTIMRKLRIDELPQAINILKGDMSLVGPRPDYIDHAKVYLKEIPGYRERYNVRPGVTGLAQTEVGYVSDEIGFRRKVAADLMYIQKMSLPYDLRVIYRTVIIVVGRHGR